MIAPLPVSSSTTRWCSTVSEPVFRVQGLKKYYNQSEGVLDAVLNRLGSAGDQSVKAVDGVSFEVQSGETFGLVGESGCGKSTVAEAVTHLLPPTDGTVEFRSANRWVDLTDNRTDMKNVRREVQIVFQNPKNSFNPRRTIGEAVRRPLQVHNIGTDDEQRERVRSLLDKVGLGSDYYHRYPHELSGGQLQRVAIAKALSLDPTFVVLDEPVSALDVSVKAQILNLLEDLQSEFEVTYFIISHDLSVIEYLADRIAVMYLGKIAEIGPNEEVFGDPSHPYTRALLSTVPKPNPRPEVTKINLAGEVPSPSNPPSGCRFHTRCPVAIEEECRTEEPVLRSSPNTETEEHRAACHLMERDLEFDTYTL